MYSKSIFAFCIANMLNFFDNFRFVFSNDIGLYIEKIIKKFQNFATLLKCIRYYICKYL